MPCPAMSGPSRGPIRSRPSRRRSCRTAPGRARPPSRRRGRTGVAVEVHAEDDVHGLGEAHETPCGVVYVEVLEPEPVGFADDGLGALQRDHLHGESPLGAEVLHLASRPVGEVRHDLDEIGQVSLAAWLDALAVLAREDVADALRVGQRRAHPRIEADRPHPGPRAHLPAEPGDDMSRRWAGRAKEQAVGLAGRALGLLGQGIAWAASGS